ncbi:F-box domain, FBD domain, Leucine-rich repeat domain, L domain-like protein [Artemisia annua]|uniref:F-box domain, FBD domain, Leucine-rich repeat domain, L domain-like protein n=1 Tax=Artemisia annua TaxID=35608 RepID=A0A2U1LXA5_ARTAN|nr:F-box domain, FBD domain, Leucine-rich repeat domain, L domain-like protein [Artemisia annua]
MYDMSIKFQQPFAIELVRGFPNLETLVICLQLKEVDLGYIKGLENDGYLMKSLLAGSRFLKKMIVRFSLLGRDDREQLKFAKKLLTLHRASPTAETEIIEQ